MIFSSDLIVGRHVKQQKLQRMETISARRRVRKRRSLKRMSRLKKPLPLFL